MAQQALVVRNTFKQYSVILEQMSSLKVQLESQTSHARVLEQVAVFMSLTLPDPDPSELPKSNEQ